MPHGSPQRDRPYDTSEPDALSSVISKLFAARGYGRVQSDRQLHEDWKRVVGDDVAAQTRVLNLRNGVLQIGVSNSALLSELASFRKHELLEQLRRQNVRLKVRDLKFKLRSDLK